MKIVIAVLAVVLVLGLVGMAGAIGYMAGRRRSREKAAGEDVEARQRLEREQEAFRELMNYNRETAYRMGGAVDE